MFTGRERELQYLKDYYGKQGSQILVVYGQKGIGKTTLLEHFMEGRDCWYYEALSCSSKQQRVFMANYLADMGFLLSDDPQFKDIFLALEDRAHEKKILVIDEFQNMCKTDMEFFEALEEFMGREGIKKELFIILCSSAIGWIENTMVSKLGSLSGILNGFYKIRELKYQDFVSNFPGFSKEDSIGAFGILGGIPGLWQFFSDTMTLRDNVESFILESDRKLHDYGQQYVAEELRETAVYNTILAVLAGGRDKLNDLYLYTGFSRAKISVYLKNLMQLEIVEKVFSLDSEGRDHTRKGVYRIKQPYIHFYYRYLFPNQSKLKTMQKESFYEEFIAPTLPSFVADCFKQVCHEFVEKENRLGRLPGSFTPMGKWIGKMGKIDFIFQEEEVEEILAGICNWEKEIMTYEDYEMFVECQDKSKIKADYMILFSAAKFDNRLKDEAKKNPRLALVTMEQMG